jgi:hypothetical protein
MKNNWKQWQKLKLNFLIKFSVAAMIYFLAFMYCSEDVTPDANEVPDSDAITNDPSIIISDVVGQASENGGNAFFAVMLGTKPDSEVTINISSDNEAEAVVSPSFVSFSGDNWNNAQSVMITGIDDDVKDGDINFNVIIEPAVSDDADYNGMDADDLALVNLDNDTPGITVSLVAGNTSELGTSTNFTIVLKSQPGKDVTINLSSDNINEGVVSPNSVTFTPDNWFVPQTVTITGVSDDVQDGDTIYHIITAPAVSQDPNYKDIDADDIEVTNVDIDTASIVVSIVSGDTTEGGNSVGFTVVLTSEPTDVVNINLSSDNPPEGTVTPGSISFDSSNWYTPQLISVTGQDDFVQDGDVGYNIVIDPATSADLTYNTMDADDVNILNIDDDVSGITVSAISGDTSETGNTATFTIVLDSKPVDDVVIDLSSDNELEGTVSPSQIAFIDSEWYIQQTITVTGVDDFFEDGNVIYNIITSNATSILDSNYDNMIVDDVQVTNIDDDTAGITVSSISGNTSEDLTTATFTIVLNSQPQDDVTIDFSSDNTGEGDVSPPSVTFIPGEWDLAKTITVTGANDAIKDGNITYNIITSDAVSLGDSDYDGLVVDDVAVINIDNEPVGIQVSSISGDTSESGMAAVFSVVLDTQPTDDVDINVYSDDVTEGEPDPGSLTFTDLNWDMPQIVIVNGLNDDEIDGNIIYNIVLDPATSLDGRFDGYDPPDVAVTNLDTTIPYDVGVSVSGLSVAGLVVQNNGADDITIDIDGDYNFSTHLTNN